MGYCTCICVFAHQILGIIIFRSARTSYRTFGSRPVRPARKKNPDHLYSLINHRRTTVNLSKEKRGKREKGKRRKREKENRRKGEKEKKRRREKGKKGKREKEKKRKGEKEKRRKREKEKK